jgi:hypothetical protein
MEPSVRASAGMRIAMHSTQGERISSNERLVCAGQTQRHGKTACRQRPWRSKGSGDRWCRVGADSPALRPRHLRHRNGRGVPGISSRARARSRLLPRRRSRSLRIGHTAAKPRPGASGRRTRGWQHEGGGWRRRSAMTASEQLAKAVARQSTGRQADSNRGKVERTAVCHCSADSLCFLSLSS